MGRPFAFAYFHFAEARPEGGSLRTAGVDAEAYPVGSVEHMTDAHLSEAYSVKGILYAEVILSAAETKPNAFYRGVNIHSGPVGITLVSDHTAETLEQLIFILNGGLEPVITVKIHDNTALVKTLLAFKFGLNGKGEILLSII